MSKATKRLLTTLLYLIGIPVTVLLGALLWHHEKYNLVSIAVAFLSCVPFFLRFEKSKTSARELVVLSVMVALSVVGRLIFMPLPAFKPVSAMVIITGIAFGPVAGFMTGSMSAVISNIFFGQGPWTPFQMLIWGLIGYAAGLVFRRGIRPHPLALVAAGVVGGFMFSVGMDVWTTLSSDGGFTWARYGFYALSALPVTITYAVSNVIFLLILTWPMLKKTERLRVKYGVFDDDARNAH